MKTHLLILILTAVFALQTNAQTEIGLTGGINFSDAWQKKLYFYNPGFETKLAIGGIVEFPLNKYFSLRVEPQYVEKGTSGGDFTLDHNSSSSFIDLSYFEFPVLIKYSVGKEVMPYLIAGPTFGINLSSSIGLKNGFINSSIDADNFINNFELSLNFGGGINYHIDEILTIFLEVKYVFGLTNILKNGDVGFDYGNSHENISIPGGTFYDNRGIQIMFGFTFPIKVN